MKATLGAIFFCACLAIAVQARCTTLPDACGDDKTKFEVQTQKGAPPLAAPAAGQALVVFIESFDKGSLGFCIGCNATVRAGIDGSWVGANQSNSYFAVAVAPGEHHLCANWQSAQGRLAKKVGMASLAAEAGKTYYFETMVAEVPGQVSGAPNGAVTQSSDWSFTLKQLSDDEGKYQLKLSALAVSTKK